MVAYSIDRPTFIFNFLCFVADVFRSANLLAFSPFPTSSEVSCTLHVAGRRGLDLCARSIFACVAWLFFAAPSQQLYSVFFLPYDVTAVSAIWFWKAFSLWSLLALSTLAAGAAVVISG